MIIYMATWLFDRSLGKSLTKKKSRNRLVSYYFLREQQITTEQLNRYCRTGRLDTRKLKEDME